MKSKYIIRSIDFFYSDEYNYPAEGFGSLEATFLDKEEAEEALLKLEQKRLSGIRVEDFEPISNCCNPSEEKENLITYVNTTFGVNIRIKREKYDGYFVDENYHLPSNLTLEQTKKIREISGIRFHHLIEISEKNNLWGIKVRRFQGELATWVTGYGYRMGENGYEDGKIPMIFNTQKDAEKYLEENGNSSLWNKEFKGTLEELSESPNILKYFIDENEKIEYHEVNNVLKIGIIYGDTLTKVHALLTEKMMYLEPFPVDEFEKYKDWHANQ